MTDREALFTYRIKQAEETLTDAQGMLKNKLSPRSIINRAYYTMFYSILALFLKTEITVKTSKHTGIISIFDKEFVHKGRIDKNYSKMLHKMFDVRQECDYKEYAESTEKDAVESVKLAKKFLNRVKQYLRSNPN